MSLMQSLAAIVVTALAQPQTADFGGTWKLDASRSTVNAEATLAGLIGAGAPDVLHITHPANGTLVVESQVNESHSRLYVPGAETSTAVFLGTAGTITMTSRWDDGTLTSEGTRSSASAKTPVKESFSLSEDGRTLTIEVAAGDSVSTFRYTRIQSVGPCESWPSPCKDFSSLERR